MKKRKILYVIPFAALVLSGCTFQDGINWLGTNIYEPVKNWIVSLFGGKKDEPKPEPEPGPGPQPVDKVYTPDEVIAMCDQVGAGVVVPDLLKVEGTVALGSKMGDHGWEGKFITEGEKDLVFESANGFASEESLDGATIVLEGYAELFNGKYKVGYLPASASPTGSAYSPTILSVTQPGEKEIKAITSIDVNTLYTISVGDSISKKDVVANLEYTDGSIGQVTPDYIDYDTSEAGEKALTVHVGNWEGTTYITVANLPHYTPEEVIALCDVATEGKVVEGLLRVEGFVEAGSTFDEKYGWSGKFAKESEKQLEFGSAATNKEYATLDNKFIQVEGYAELYNGVYKVAYLPANASPTGEKYNPVLVSVETKDVTPATVEITSALEVGIGENLLLKATVGPVGAPQDVVWSIESGADYATLDGAILTGVAAGEVVVKATVKDHADISDTKTVTVVDGSTQFVPEHAGTEQDPYSASDILGLYAELETGKYTNTAVYVSGTVVADPAPSLYNGRYSFTLTDGQKTLYVYNMNAADNTASFQEGDVAAGNVVVLTGAVKNHNGALQICYNSTDKVNCHLISIEKPSVVPTSVEITSAAEIGVGEDLELKATVGPAGAPQDVVWSIESGADYATLSEGKLHGVAAGEVVVKATAKDHADVSATKTVTVVDGSTQFVPEHAGTEQDPYSASDIQGLYAELETGKYTNTAVYVSGTVVADPAPSLYNGRYSFTLTDGTKTVNVYNMNNADNTASLVEGDVIAGSVVVLTGAVKNHNGSLQICYNSTDKVNCYLISIDKPVVVPTSVEITSGTSVYVGEDLTLAATVGPAGAPQDVVWSIESGADYATLSEGKLHGVAAGEVVVKATAKDHADVSATKTVTVSEKSDVPPTGDTTTYTINYTWTHTSASQTSKNFSNLSNEEIMGALVSDNEKIITGYKDATNAYFGANGGSSPNDWILEDCLKLGKSGAKGTVTFTLDQTKTFSKIKFGVLGNRDDGQIVVNGTAKNVTNKISSTNMEPTYIEFDIASGVDLTIATKDYSSSNYAIFVTSIEFI